MRNLIFIMLISVTSCSEEPFRSEKSLMDEKKFIDVYEEVLVLENYYQTKYGVPSAYKNALDGSCHKVFTKHQVSKKDFEKSFDYYAHRPEKLKSINEQVIARLNKKKL
ncbi:MAG: DUF4296 domain-containing protein [Bacteroidetes bacterium]|nr:DUF4296 domain-containing protein [Bacteroidota bacterium]